VYIDADKINYSKYSKAALRLLSPRGVIVVDNCLWGGDVVNPASRDPETKVIRDLNATLGRDRAEFCWCEESRPRARIWADRSPIGFNGKPRRRLISVSFFMA
jgi:hypothetical protein